MVPTYNKINELLKKRAELNARLRVLPYQGTPEIKTISNLKYVYLRKRIAGKLTSSYIGPYSDELYNLLLKNAQEIREINKELRKIEKELLAENYTNEDLPFEVLRNIDFARANLKINIYDQAVLEGVPASFSQLEAIIDNEKVNDVLASDVLKILNLKHAREFILDKDVISCRSDYYLLSKIAELVNEGFYMDGGRIRGVPVTIGGTSYIPPLPNELDVKEKILEILSSNDEVINKAIKLKISANLTTHLGVFDQSYRRI